ncbi:hypothetical protein Q4543_01965 [Salipiger sp. 1_MG-2023]|uniref:hypothetical protein n=1 Tax=Salipiger sp. 1_MG-2023 TaxID=3062665 RepID=UPI0026E3C4E4|nr:hypothetical protein [Salipiger sp. 1_MG-2023]MDO6584273.1 hypothetical protein [Salipiger sp. 1_MG-2023]
MNCPGDRYRLRLFGPFELRAPDGRAVTLGRKAQGLVAILACQDGRAVPRVRLQDLLWSLSGPEHGRDSLKKCLRQLRTALGEDADGFVLCRADGVALNKAAIDCDLEQVSPEGAFLEGLDLNDPEFEDWLRETRSRLRRPRSVVVSGQGRDAGSRLRIAVGALRTLPQDMLAEMGAGMLLGRLVSLLSQNDLIDLRDLRDADLQSLGGADARLASRAMTSGDRICVQLALIALASGRVIWSEDVVLPVDTGTDRAALAGTVARLAGQIERAVCREDRETGDGSRAASRLMLDGIERLFHLGPGNTDAAVERFRRAAAIESRGSFKAWLALTTAFRLESSKGRDAPALRDEAEQLTAEALDEAPDNPLVRSLLAHVSGFVLRDFDRANALLTPLEGSDPATPMYHFALSMLRFYEGRLDAAQQAAVTARQRGGSHPYAYAFSTGLSMIALCRGDAVQAVAHGREARGLMPLRSRPYEPTLRYLTAAQAQAGQLADARNTWDALCRADPHNDAKNLRDSNFPVPAEHAREALGRSFRALHAAVT